MHDVKNLASQLSLLARNAELHADNPEFRADMLLTLRNSADKLSALLAIVAVLLGGLILVGVVMINGITGVELEMLAGQMDMTPITAALVLAGASLALSFPMTLAGFRIGAGQVAKQIEKQAKLTGI